MDLPYITLKKRGRKGEHSEAFGYLLTDLQYMQRTFLIQVGDYEKNTEKAWDALRELTDPELPFLTLNDLGVIRDIKIRQDNYIVTIAPTYIGCPALSVIEDRITSN